MQKNLKGKPKTKNLYITNHSLLQETKQKINTKNSIVINVEEQFNEETSKNQKRNAFKVVPLEIFEDELENYLDNYYPQIKQIFKEMFLSSYDEIIKEKKNYCETYLIEIYNYIEKINTKIGLAILFVNKVEFFIVK